MKKVLVCGGRDFNDWKLLNNTLHEINMSIGIAELIHGDARGADRMADTWATQNNIAVTAVPADWNKYGKSAGYRRNEQMAKLQPDLVVAFPGGVGTQHMITLCQSYKLPVRIVK